MANGSYLDMLKSVLLNNQVQTLYRNECVLTHDFLSKISKLKPNTNKLSEILKEKQTETTFKET
jgi:6-phosphogluconate dehydrogenase